ncbi:hypothetical protein HAX54_016925, partial [Datura stramonium]|nr:hypothetical protein [Datura stramonium]
SIGRQLGRQTVDWTVFFPLRSAQILWSYPWLTGQMVNYNDGLWTHPWKVSKGWPRCFST